jgi:hypothetical protein
MGDNIALKNLCVKKKCSTTTSQWLQLHHSPLSTKVVAIITTSTTSNMDRGDRDDRGDHNKAAQHDSARCDDENKSLPVSASVFVYSIDIAVFLWSCGLGKCVFWPRAGGKHVEWTYL